MIHSSLLQISKTEFGRENSCNTKEKEEWRCALFT